MGIWECKISLTKVLSLLISPQFCFISAYKIQNNLNKKPCSVFAEKFHVVVRNLTASHVCQQPTQ